MATLKRPWSGRAHADLLLLLQFTGWLYLLMSC